MLLFQSIYLFLFSLECHPYGPWQLTILWNTMFAGVTLDTKMGGGGYSCDLWYLVHVQIIRQMTSGGADYAFECVGSTEVVTSAIQSCCEVTSLTPVWWLLRCLMWFIFDTVHRLFSQGWGLTVTLGVPKVKPEITAHYALFLSGRTLKGSLFGGWKPKSDIPNLVDMYVRKVRFTLVDLCAI